MPYRTHPVRLVGGRLCLDFLNTADWSTDGVVVDEKLADLQDVAIWCRAVGMPDDGRGRFSTVADLTGFRAQLRHVFLSAMAGRPPAPDDVAALNGVLSERPDDSPLVARDGILAFAEPVALRWILAQSALGVLTAQSEIGRVKLCPGDSCGWLFLDETRNRRRRWCSMETCGNRAKARRHYERSLGTGDPTHRG